MATFYNPDGLNLVLPADSTYTPPPATNVVMDVPSGDPIYRHVAGNVQVAGFPASREVFVVSYLKQNIPDVGQRRVLLGDGTSNPTDGSFAIDVGLFSEPVLVVAMDNYGTTWQPDTSYAEGDVVHPANPDSYKGFVYECTKAGITGKNEPDWWIDTGSSNTGTSGTATFQAKQYFQPICHGAIVPAPKPKES